jgi:hypothetical protein
MRSEPAKPSLVCYAQPEKRKSQRVLQAFADGCGGAMASTRERRLRPGAAAFYGVRPAWMHLWDQARSDARDWYYVDNAWFDASREKHFRIARNAVQGCTSAASDGKRFAALGIEIHAWRRRGSRVLVLPQSAEFMATLERAPDWTAQAVTRVRQFTDRPIAIRRKDARTPLAADLEDAWIAVVHSSAAAVAALLYGVPVIATDPACAMAPLATRFEDIESPHRPDDRLAWAQRLADSQWTLEEMKAGLAWRSLDGG